MSATTTVVGICNIALGELRANLIASLGDQSKEAKLCNTNYDRLREEVLESREWRFATRRLKLALSADTPEFGYPHQFKLPADCLRVLSASDNPNGVPAQENNINWEREEDFVLSDSAAVYIRYTVNLAITTKFSPGFVTALAKRMSAQMAIALTGSDKRHDALLKEYFIMVSAGSTRDGMQGKAKKRRPGALEKARYQGSGGYFNVTGT